MRTLSSWCTAAWSKTCWVTRLERTGEARPRSIHRTRKSRLSHWPNRRYCKLFVRSCSSAGSIAAENGCSKNGLTVDHKRKFLDEETRTSYWSNAVTTSCRKWLLRCFQFQLGSLLVAKCWRARKALMYFDETLLFRISLAQKWPLCTSWSKALCLAIVWFELPTCIWSSLRRVWIKD